MQDEVNEKVVSLAIKTSKLTAEVLQKAMKALLAKGKGQLTKAPHGKITMRQLMKQGEKVSNIEITDQNIKAFDPIARKSGLDYNVKKIENGKPPTYLVHSDDAYYYVNYRRLSAHRDICHAAIFIFRSGTP